MFISNQASLKQKYGSGNENCSLSGSYTSSGTSEEEYSHQIKSKHRIYKAVKTFNRELFDPFIGKGTGDGKGYYYGRFTSSRNIVIPSTSNGNVSSEETRFEVSLRKFIAIQIEKGLSNDEVEELYIELITSMASDRKETDSLRLLRVFGKFCLSTIDTLTDILITLTLINTNNTMAIIQGASLMASFIIQSFFSYYLKQPTWMVLLGLIGMKPVFEAWREAVQAKQLPNQKFSNTNILFITRAIEITSEAVPQSIIQIVSLLLNPASRTNLTYVSILSSVLTAGFFVSFSDRQIDMDKNRRLREPLFIGYVPLDGSTTQLIAMVMFFSCYNVLKVASIAVLIVSFSVSFVIFLCVCEIIGFLMFRIWYKNWRFYLKDSDSFIVSLCFHIGIYAGMTTAPFPILRHPKNITPLIYTSFVVYILMSNFLSFHMALNCGGRKDWQDSVINDSFVWTFAISITSICIVTALVFFYFVPNKVKPSFYQQTTLKNYLKNFHWNEMTCVNDQNDRLMRDQDYIRALIPIKYSKYYYPDKLLIEFYGSMWERWCNDPPDWFDDLYKENVPKELLIEVERESKEVEINSSQSSSQLEPNTK